jgi:ParB-like chromosome segregation protein Spo0J
VTDGPRIITGPVETGALSELKHPPPNARQGDVGAVYESIQANGFYGTLIVQRSTGHVLVGNHRMKAAAMAGLSELPVQYVDVTDEEALRILLVDNRANDLATYDEAELADVLKELAASEPGLSGTGYDGDDLDDLLQKLEDMAPPMPAGDGLGTGSDGRIECPECGHKFDAVIVQKEGAA